MPQLASLPGRCVAMMWVFLGEVPLGSSLNLRADPCQAEVSPFPTAPPPPAPPLVPPAAQPAKHMYPLPYLTSGMLPRLGPLPTPVPMPPKPTGAPPNLADLVRYPAVIETKPTDPPAGTVYVPGKVTGSWVVPDPKHALPQGVVATKLILKVLAGATMLPVVTQAGLSIGMTMDIDAGTAVHEINRITGFGSILLATPLQFAHGAGATVTMRADSAASPSPANQLAASSPVAPSLALKPRLAPAENFPDSSAPAVTTPFTQPQPNSPPATTTLVTQQPPNPPAATTTPVNQVSQATSRIREMAGLKTAAAEASNLTNQTQVTGLTPTNQTQPAGLAAANQTQPELPPVFVLSNSPPTNQPASIVPAAATSSSQAASVVPAGDMPPPAGLMPAR